METRPVTGEAPAGHKILAVIYEEQRVRIKCECGAVWSMGTAAYERGEDHIEDHWRYARREPTRVD